METIRYIIRFDGVAAADAGRAAESLRRSLQDLDPEINAKRVRSNSDTMDFGSTLEIILAAPAIVVLAKGLANWLERTHSSRLTVVDAAGSIIVENISARDAVGLAEKLQIQNGSS